MDTAPDEAIVSATETIEASFDGLDDVHRMLERFWRHLEEAPCPQPDEHWRALFTSAVAEVAGNIIRYAYPAAAAPQRFNVSLRCLHDRIEAVMIDHGVPYEAETQSRSPDMRDALDDLDLEHGWGLPIAKAASDALVYERLEGGINRWQIDKRFSA